MLCIFNPNTDPAFNLATEEYFLKNFDDEVFMLWRNHNALVVGKHQNTLSEINASFVRERKIKVIRRLSGGGTVFHDLGNLNFTFIMNGEGEKLIDFRKYTLPILEVLQRMGVTAKFEGRNDLTIDGRKFSGNAEHIHKNRVLHHGTLLFSSHMNDLANALNAREEKFRDKSVKSVRSRVTNISEHLAEPMEVMEFAQRIMEHIQEMYQDSILYNLSAFDIEQIELLKTSKYDTWEWNYGYSPAYNFAQSVRTAGGTIDVAMDVERGVIKDLVFFGDFFNRRDPDELKALLINRRHDREDVSNALQGVAVEEYFAGATLGEILHLLAE
jgi:lipoate---protein ligase